MAVRALVLAGGGSRGAYQIGVWKALREFGMDFQIVTGTSVGALNGAMVVQGDYEFAEKMWEEISTQKVLDVDIDERLENQKNVAKTLNAFASEMFRAGGADPKPLEEILRGHIDEEKIRNSDMDFAIVTVEYPGFTPCIVNRSNFEEGKLVDYLMASASCFPAMKMRDIDGKKYIDGGYYDNMPVKLALDMGAEEIIAVDLDGIGVNKPVESSEKITCIGSYWNLGVFMLFDGEIARQNMKLGYLDALKYLGGYDGMAYTFYSGECEKLEKIGTMALESLLNIAKSEQTPFYINMGPPVAKNAILRVMAKKRHRSTLKISNMMNAAEIAAETFALSPLKIYTAEEFIAELFKAYERRKREAPDVEDILKSENIVLASENILRLLSPESRAVFCVEKVERYFETGEELQLLTALAAVMPQEFLAAVYLVSAKRLQDHTKDR